MLGAGVLGGPCARNLLAGEPDAPPAVRAGLVTDVHYADREMRINRFYRNQGTSLFELFRVDATTTTAWRTI